MTNRVDAARKLRGGGDRLFGNSFGGGSVKAMDIIRESINVAYDYDELFDHLADLIEPKAKIMIDANSQLDDDYRFCGNCKRVLPNILFNDYEITHCPYCGCLLEEPY